MSRDDFWARRKAGVEAEAIAETRAEAVALAEQHESELAEKSDAEILADLELPDPDELGQGDDFTVFLTETVPARIRTRALRRLWLTNPVLANVDGLVDYGEDFTDASCVIENIQTAYQVGKGMTAHVDELARQAAEEAADEDAEAQAEEAELAAEEPVAETTPETAAIEPDQFEVASVAFEHTMTELNEMPTDPAPRRMRFAFEQVGAAT